MKTIMRTYLKSMKTYVCLVPGEFLLIMHEIMSRLMVNSKYHKSHMDQVPLRVHSRCVPGGKTAK